MPPFTFTITPVARRRIKALVTKTSPCFRLEIKSGGCKGFQYNFAMCYKPLKEDHVFIMNKTNGSAVVIDKMSGQFLKGATLDFIETVMESGFIVKGTDLGASCGCQVSFSL